MGEHMLEVNWLGIKLKNPLIVAASTISKYKENLLKADRAGVGAILTKSIHLIPPEYKPAFRAIYYDSHLGWISTGDSRLSPEEGEELVRFGVKNLSVPIFASITGPGVDVAGWVRLACRMAEAGASAIELNFSGPTGIELAETLRESGRAQIPIFAGGTICQHPDQAREIVTEIRRAVPLPLMVKVTPEATNLRLLAKICEAAGADAMTAIDSPRGLCGVDIYQGGRCALPFVEKYPLPAMTGLWLKPLAIRCIIQIRQSTKLPVSASGGIMRWKDAIEMLMVGATTLQLSSILYLEGFESIKPLLQKMQRFMTEQEYRNISDIIGCSLKYIDTPQNVIFDDVVAKVDRSKCNLCKRCLRIGNCLARSVKGKKILVDVEKCTGCGLCYWLCKKKANRFVARKEALA
jgi:dihydroorotate dehydrogenase/NAD-dependent dihydropyrimidine dehydrogenase PreA subunit